MNTFISKVKALFNPVSEFEKEQERIRVELDIREVKNALKDTENQLRILQDSLLREEDFNAKIEAEIAIEAYLINIERYKLDIKWMEQTRDSI